MGEQQASRWNLPEWLPSLECASRLDAKASIMTAPTMVQCDSLCVTFVAYAVTCCASGSNRHAPVGKQASIA